MKIKEVLTEATSAGKDHFVIDIEKETEKNKNFRRVLFTAQGMQLVMMSLKPGEEIGTETHKAVDQFIRVEAGSGKVLFNGKPKTISDGDAFIIPRGVEHNVVNTSKTDDLKLYSVYSPPNHTKNTIHKTRADALKDDEHFDGKTNV